MEQDNSIIRIGIDLGTTNSEIAVNDGKSIDLIENSRGDLYTPSVFGISKAGDVVIGKEAYNRLFKKANNKEVSNYKAEIKRMLGTGQTMYIERNKKEYLPEEISAEILKLLKNDALRRHNEIVTLGSVITVPAYFSTQQKEATKRAGKLAGFAHVSLLQEPIAAAITYGFEKTTDETWLVYDLGGGTFDVALVNSSNGILTVIEHGGDNFCGGKDIDNLIIDEVIIPKILSKYNFSDFNRKNPNYFAYFNRMKSIAEDAKISLSIKTEVEIDLGDLDIVDENENDVDEFFIFTRKEFDKLIDNFVNSTINVTKEVISKSNIDKKSISKIILVGASTLIPYIQYKVGKKIGINVDTSQNPFTAIARGAAIFALGQRVPQKIIQDNSESNIEDEVEIELNYEAMTSQFDQLITGKVLSENSDSYKVKLSSDSGFYNSDMLKVNNGTFFTQISLEEGKTNKYWIYLIDSQGNNISTHPNSFTITHGLSIAGTPIPHTVGIIYSVQDINSKTGWTDACDVFFERSSLLPLRETKEFKTISDIKKNDECVLPIVVYEGDSLDPKFVNEVTRIGIDGKKLPVDLPKGSEVEVTIEINEAGEIYVEVYLPLADISLDARMDIFKKEVLESEILSQTSELEEELLELSDKLDEDENTGLNENIKKIKKTIESSNDTDSKLKAEKEIKALQQKIEAIKSSSEFDRVKEKFESTLDEVKLNVEEVEEMKIKSELEDLIERVELEAQEYIKNEDSVLLLRLTKQLEQIQLDAAKASPGFWIGLLKYFETNRDILVNDKEADYHISEAHKAINNNDYNGLKSHVSSLIQLISHDAQNDIPDNITGITK